jgi:hypothetical protein
MTPMSHRLTLLLSLTACTAGPAPDPTATWSTAFDTTSTGALSGVWGSGPDDIYIVGGDPVSGEIHHFDGDVWSEVPLPPGVPLLVWVYGNGPDDIWAVGSRGAIVRYDGAAWTVLDAGTDADLWGVFGFSADDVWIVGGDVVDGPPVLLHHDGEDLVPYELPPEQNARGAHALFKVWGTAGKLYAVGQRGLIVSNDGSGVWREEAIGHPDDEDFISLTGTAADNVVVVGGRATGRIATWNGTAWTHLAPLALPGISAVTVGPAGNVVLGGVYGWVGTFTPGDQAPVEEISATTEDVHAMWGDGTGRIYGVGGRFAEPFRGVAVVRDPP